MEEYFILDYKIVNKAINEYNGMLTKTGRGSAVSFYINKLLGLTQIDRLKSPITLYPTRFMSTERILATRSLPDIDLNSPSRDEFIKATEDLLGEENCGWMLAYKYLQDSSGFRLYCKSIDMKVIQSSLFRALCAIIVGALLIQYREQTVTWITIAIGVLFFLSGVFSLLSYMSAKRNAEKMKGQYLYDAQGNHIIGMRPNFPLVGLGSLIFGLVLALMPNVFIAWLMFILSTILIMGALTQMANLVSAAKMGRVGIVYWLMPTLLLLLGLFTLFSPSSIASAPLLVIGWAMLVYGVVEAVNALKVSNNRRRWQKTQEIQKR